MTLLHIDVPRSRGGLFELQLVLFSFGHAQSTVPEPQSLFRCPEEVKAEPIERAGVDVLEFLLGQRIAQAVKVEQPMTAMFGRPMPAALRIAGVVDQQ